MLEPRAPQKPAERQVVAFRAWLAKYNANTASGKFFLKLANAFALQLDSDCYRSCRWAPGELEFVTDSEHTIAVKMTYGHFDPEAVQRKAKFWTNAKGTDVVYRNWQVFGDALRQLDFVLVGFHPTANGFIAGFGVIVDNQQVTFTITATPTDRHDLSRDYSPVRAVERMAPY